MYQSNDLNKFSRFTFTNSHEDGSDYRPLCNALVLQMCTASAHNSLSFCRNILHGILKLGQVSKGCGAISISEEQIFSPCSEHSHSDRPTLASIFTKGQYPHLITAKLLHIV